jgi:heme A synthase
VLFQLVADNASMARALFMAVHLINTFVLIACLTLTAHWASGGVPVRLGGRTSLVAALTAGVAGLLLVGTSGAIAALGDTLFPAGTVAEALAADVSATSHALVRLRLLHPALAIVVGLALAGAVPRLRLAGGDRRGRLAVRAVTATALLQLAAGFVNVLLLAPVWMQMVHLLLADLLWIAYVIAAASALSAETVVVEARRPVHVAG